MSNWPPTSITDLLGAGAGVAVDVLSNSLDKYLSQLSHTALAEPLEPASNTLLSQAAHDFRFGQPGTQRAGRIQVSVPFFNYYQVAMENGDILPCTRLTDAGSTSLFGVRDISVLPPNSVVSVFKPANALWGYITGVLPQISEDGNYSFADWIFQGSGVGVRRLAYYRDLLRRLGDGGGIRDFSDHRPADQLVFDWGRMTSLGSGLHIDPFHLFLRIDESCGLFGYYQDQLLRLCGLNLDVWSLQHSEQRRHDEGELTYHAGECIYPWEAMGVFQPGDLVYRENEDKAVLFEQAEGKIEPKNNEQYPFYRYEEYGGYLGQGRIRQMAIPPQDVVSQETNRIGDGLHHPVGVFREQIALDGSYSLFSSKQLILAKRSLIPLPRRQIPQESYCEDGDSVENENYRFSGHFGKDETDEHVVGDLQTADARPHLMSAAAILDVHAYSANWKSLHAFHYHAGDYLVPEEKNLGKVQDIPPFEYLQSSTWLPSPPWGQSEGTLKKVDERYGGVRYHEVLSHLTLDEYGNVILQGGAGEEIRFVGGSIQISCPGNILLQSGKSTVTMAGRDAVVRARKSVDITASTHDVRLKAERNMQLLSGNSGLGGTLIENRAISDKQDYPAEGGEQVEGSGIVFKSASSHVSALAQSIYLRTGGPEGGIGSGDIVMDADKGRADIRTTAGTFYRYLGAQAVDSFGLPTPRATNISNMGVTRVGTRLDVSGAVRGTESATFMNSVTAVTGHYQSAQGGLVGRLLDVSRQRNILAAEIDVPSSADTQNSQSDYRSNIETEFYGNDKIGEGETQQVISCSLRTEEEYGTSDFVLPQTHWQILAEAGEASVDVWEETTVEYQESSQQPFMPWPGYRNWTADTFLRVPPEQFKMYDIQNGYSKARGEEYEDKQLGETQASKPQETYAVIPN